MSLNLGVLYTHLLWVVISVIVLVAVKILVLYLLARLYGVRSSERMQFAGVLSGAASLPLYSFLPLLHNAYSGATRWRCCW